MKTRGNKNKLMFFVSDKRYTNLNYPTEHTDNGKCSAPHPLAILPSSARSARPLCSLEKVPTRIVLRALFGMDAGPRPQFRVHFEVHIRISLL